MFLLKRYISVKTSILFILISILPVLFAAFVILQYTVAERTAILKEQLANNAEQVITLLKRRLGNDLLEELYKRSSILAFIVDDRGSILFTSTDANWSEKNNAEITKLFWDWKNNLKNNRAAETVAVKELSEGNRYLVLLHGVPDSGKTIILLEPAVTYTGLLKHFYPPLVIVLVFMLGIISALNYLAYIRIFRPINRLTAAATRVAQNDFDINIEDNRQDEIGRLTQVFNKSIAQIRVFNQMNIDKIIIERKKLEHIIEQLAGGILIVNPENKILICNQVLAKWYNIDKQSIINKKLSELDTFQVFYEMIYELNQKRKEETIHKKIMHQTGDDSDTRVLQASATNIFTSGKTFLGTSIYIRDITKEHEIDKLKSELISIVAHELRSPLVSVIGFSEILLEENADSELCKEYLKIIHSESTRLSEFVENFLDLTKIESGTFILNAKEANLIQTIEQVISVYQKQAEAKNISITTDFVPPLQIVKYDSMLLERAIGNYLSNAIKYNPPNTQITVKSYIEDDQVHVEVIDNGTGIAEDNLDKVFDKFYRVSDSKTKSKKGSGLGLSFVKLVIEKHQGNVYVKSKPNEGSTFGFSLPLNLS